MFVGSRFPDDTNDILMKVQSDLYSVLLGFLYGYPRERYLSACRLVQSSTYRVCVLHRCVDLEAADKGLRKIVEHQNASDIARTYASAMVNQFESDLQTPKAAYQLS